VSSLTPNSSAASRMRIVGTEGSYPQNPTGLGINSAIAAGIP
jgi:hypothetical protein